jgi:hypothetical protein
MKLLKYLALALLFTLTCALSAKEDSAKLYLLRTTDDTTKVEAIDVKNNTRETLYSIPDVVDLKGPLNALFPDDEVQAITEHFTKTGENAPTLDGLLITGRIKSITASPDQQQVVAQVIYQNCYFQQKLCFGTTQLVLIDSRDKNQRLLLNLAFHSKKYGIGLASIDTRVGEVEWLSDGMAIVVSMIDTSERRPNVPSTIAIFLVHEASYVEIGKGLTWVVSPDSREITYVSLKDTFSDIPNTLSVVDLELATSKFSKSTHPLGSWYIFEEAGLAYLGTNIVFQVGVDIAMGERPSGGVAVFDLQTKKASMFLPNQGFSKFQSTHDGTAVIAQTRDNHLSKLVMNGDKIEVTPMVTVPVVHWNLSANDQLLVQYERDNRYQILDLKGQEVDDYNPESLSHIPALTDSYTPVLDW